MVKDMSDPVTNAEVEDVLSSIRRLVSEDKRPMAKSQPLPVKDRLVLTPALRVAEASDAQADPETAPLRLERTDNVQFQPENDFEKYKEPAVFQAGRLHDQKAEEDNEAEDDNEASDDAEDTSGSMGAFYHDRANDRSHDREVEDEHGAVVPQNDDDDGQEQRADGVAAENTQDFDHDEADEADEMDNDTVASVEAEHHARTSDNTANGGLTAKIAELEAVVGKISDNWEPDDAGADEYSGTDALAMEWEDDVERDATGARLDVNPPLGGKGDSRQHEAPEASKPLSAETVRASAEEGDMGSMGFGSDDQILDEEALRDLVSEIVRSELQGALGERITRNVRKLVRREIHRALTAQELE